MQHLSMLHDVVLVWPGSCNNVAPGHAHQFDLQHPYVATRSNRVAKRAQHAAHNNVAICCVEMLRSFGRGLINNVAIAGARNFSSTGIRKHIHVFYIKTRRVGSKFAFVTLTH